VSIPVSRATRDLGEPAAHPEPLDVIDRGRLEAQRPHERDLAAIDLDLRRLEILPARTFPVLPLEQAGEIAAAALGGPEEDAQQRGITGVREPWIREVQVALDALRTGEHLERSVGGAGDRVDRRLFSGTPRRSS
jgi:hypothetical protein